MSHLTTRDGAELFYKDWGSGSPILFSHGWPLCADAWDAQMIFFGERGYRVIAHDRRSHGRSSATWTGNDVDTYADDLGELIHALDLRNLTLVGHCTGGGEVVRYLGRHGSARVARVILVGAVPPLVVRTEENPQGTPIRRLDELREGICRNRSQLLRDLAAPFFGFNRGRSEPVAGLVDDLWRQGMMAGIKGVIDCIAQFWESDFTFDLEHIDVPTLIVHGDDDQIVPIDASARKAVRLVKDATLEVYRGAPHGLPVTHGDRLNASILEFLRTPTRAGASTP